MPRLIIRSAFASVTGRQHEASGTPCQDAALLHRLGRSGVIAAVADGAGSARHAEIGASVAVSAATHVLATLKSNVFALDEPKAVLNQIQEALTAKACEIGCEVRDLACTLMAVLVMKCEDDFGWAAFHIGDGVIAAEMDGQLQVLSRPENGEFGNSTYFLTDAGASTRFRAYKGQSKAVAFALMTDGAAESLYHRASGRLAPAVGTLVGWSRSLHPQTYKSALNKNMRNVISIKTGDDATLAIVSLGIKGA
nr:PP2C family serine/threonine-protein phosphatase [Skermanella sp. TT6]